MIYWEKVRYCGVPPFGRDPKKRHGVKIALTEDELTLIVHALYQYHAYLISQKREDRRYVDLAELLEGAGKGARKPPALQSAQHRSRARR